MHVLASLASLVTIVLQILCTITALLVELEDMLVSTEIQQ